jgi:trafficking kinesin-binding protein 1
MNDTEALHALLLEREQELEVAAKVGQLLLQRNELLESDLTAALDLKETLESTAAQLKHEVSKKENLLSMYIHDLVDEMPPEQLLEGEFLPEWIQMLREESRSLRSDNTELRTETEYLRSQAETLERKERDLVQQCMKQLAEANSHLKRLQSDSGSLSTENKDLLTKLSDFSCRIEDLQQTQTQLFAENEVLKEKLSDAHVSHAQLTAEVTELSEKHEECSMLWKEAQEEIQTLKAQQPFSSSFVDTDSNSSIAEATTGESLVCEIEDAIRRELVSSEKPTANGYVNQHAKVVMETVKSTIQTQQKREKLIKEIEDLLECSATADSKGVPMESAGVSTHSTPVSQLGEPRTSSPAPSDTFSVSSMGEELRKYRGPYIAPEKLKIVKPLEGSLTLLKWKLLATPHLGGATSFFSPASRPGIHVKGTGEMDTSQSSNNSARKDGFPSSLNSSRNLSEADPRESTPIQSPNSVLSTSSMSQGLAGLLATEERRGTIVHSPSVKRASPRVNTGSGLASLLDDYVD